MRLFVSLLLIAVIAAAQTPKPLDIYVVDVEGGNAALFVTPTGESILIYGNAGGTTGRDASRILDTVGTPNPAPVHNGAAFWFKISAQQDGSFSNEDQKRFQQKVRDKELIC